MVGNGKVLLMEIKIRIKNYICSDIYDFLEIIGENYNYSKLEFFKKLIVSKFFFFLKFMIFGNGW